MCYVLRIVLKYLISDIGTIHETILDHGGQRRSPVFYGSLHIQARLAPVIDSKPFAMVKARYIHSPRKRNILLYT